MAPDRDNVKIWTIARSIVMFSLFFAILAVLLAETTSFEIKQLVSLSFWGGEKPAFSEVLRNLGLLGLGITGLWLAYDRTKTASRQADIAERGQNNERFQKAAEMLGHKRLSVREAGIFSLIELAKADMSNQCIPVQKVLCSYIKDRTMEIIETEPYTRIWDFDYDIWEAFVCCIKLHNDARNLFNLESVTDFSGLQLNEGWFSSHEFKDIRIEAGQFERSNFQQVSFIHSDLNNSIFEKSTLNNCVFDEINGNNISFNYCDFFETTFEGAFLSDIYFKQAELNTCVFDHADLSYANFKGAVFENCSFEQSKLIEAHIEAKWEHLFTKEQWATVNVIDEDGKIIRPPLVDNENWTEHDPNFEPEPA